jgi:peptidase E
MAKLYLLGGENIVKRTAKEINLQAFQDAGGAPKVVVFSWARPSFDSKYRRRKRVFNYLRSLGACNVDFIEYLDSSESIAAKVAGSDLVYLTGGQLSILVSRLKKRGVDNLFRSYGGVIVGRSAGALALCKDCIVTLKSNQKSKFVSGLGLADFAIKVHYISSKDVFLKKLSKQHKIYAVPESSALIYDKKNLSFMGEVFVFQNEEKFTLI